MRPSADPYRGGISLQDKEDILRRKHFEFIISLAELSPSHWKKLLQTVFPMHKKRDSEDIVRDKFAFVAQMSSSPKDSTWLLQNADPIFLHKLHVLVREHLMLKVQIPPFRVRLSKERQATQIELQWIREELATGWRFEPSNSSIVKVT